MHLRACRECLSTMHFFQSLNASKHEGQFHGRAVPRQKATLVYRRHVIYESDS